MKSGDVKRGRELLQTDPGGHSHGTQLAGVGLACECLCSAHRTAGACRCDFSNWFENLAKHYLRFQRKNAEVYCAGCTWSLVFTPCVQVYSGNCLKLNFCSSLGK